MPFQDLSRFPGVIPAGIPQEKKNIFDDIMAGVEKFYPAYQKAQDDRAKREKDTVEMYVKLREAGYSPKEAHTATLAKVGFPEPSGGYKTKEEFALEKAGYDTQKAKLDVEEAEAKKAAGYGNKKTDLQVKNLELSAAIKEKRLTEGDEGLVFGNTKTMQPTKLPNKIAKIPSVNSEDTLRTRAIKILKDAGRQVDESTITTIVSRLKSKG